MGQGGGYGCRGRLGGGEDAAFFRFQHGGVVQAVHRVGNRLCAAQYQLVDQFVAAARLNHRYFGIVGALEGGKRVFRQAERFVHSQPHFRLRLYGRHQKGGCCRRK